MIHNHKNSRMDEENGTERLVWYVQDTLLGGRGEMVHLYEKQHTARDIPRMWEQEVCKPIV